ncbi:putative hydrolase YxeP [Clostridium acetireducens DSM 10703]|jgi:amidohydrolase|uniref:Putative hydrolase YxeP n=1 Tax=Clostridium acetireducens DSM 10703 TaxID=1121290 RepID=A0A1E8EX10_9CLOT|nr:M20 family metallopeptidase [Clostridium acetireducens]OFI05302.1 putative hydrolase YxeP [Clostridium acetireducens DSM 10703]
MEVKDLAYKYKQYVIDMRREFHSNPEVSFKEFKTSKRIKEELKYAGIEFQDIASTGVLATIKGKKHGKTILLRADMDALQLEECTNFEYKSKNKGIMHACGHDGHIAMLLGAAKILNDLKDKINGTVKLVFQPAEEIGEGAKKVIEEGGLEGVDSVFAMHLWSDLECGKVSVEEGPRMSAGDVFKIKVKGKGGHGALPHECIDSVVVASSIIMNLQSIVSRQIDPLESAVVTVGSLKSGSRFNIIANEAILEGVTRCFDDNIRSNFPSQIENIAKNIAAAYNAEAQLEYKFITPVTFNDSKCSSIAQKSLIKLLGEEGISKMKKMTVTEDFAFYLEKVPGVLAFVGVKNPEKHAIYPQHSEKYTIDEDALEIGASLYAQYAIDFLNS